MLTIRGQRILDILLNERTYQELKNNTLRFTPTTRKRQHAIDPVQVVELEITPYQQSKALKIRGRVNSRGKQYETILSFSDVTYEPEDTSTNVTFTASDENEYHMQSIPLSQSNVKVRCTCLDFRWRFSYYNKSDNSLYGRGPGPYLKRTNRPPVNPKKVPGMCKHLLKTVVALKDAGLVRE